MEWSREEISRELYSRRTTDRPINPASLPKAMVRAMRQEFGSLDLAYEYFGCDPSGVMRKSASLSATELIIEIQAWKKQRGQVRFSEMMSEKPGLVEQIQRIFGDVYKGIYRAGLNPYEEHGLLVPGSTLWFNPTDFYLSIGGNWPTVMGSLHDVELPVLAWDIHGQPRLWPVTFVPYSPAGLTRDDLIVGQSWFYHDLSVADLDTLAILSAEVMLFGILPMRQGRDPGCSSTKFQFTLDEVVARYPASWWPKEMVACKRDIVHTATEALTVCFNRIDLRHGPIVAMTRIIFGHEAYSTATKIDESEHYFLESKSWELELNPDFFGRSHGSEGDSLLLALRKSTPVAGYYDVLPPGADRLNWQERQVLSLAQNLVQQSKVVTRFDGQRVAVSQPISFQMLGRLLWWKEVPELIKYGPEYPPQELHGSVIPFWERDPLPAEEFRLKIQALLPRIREVWPILRRWDFDEHAVRFIFAAEP